MDIYNVGLLQYTHITAEWKKSKVISVSARKVYCVQDGRNAWHSTWVQRRYNNSFRIKPEDSKTYAEDSRTCGSVFLIVEVPCLAFETSLGFLLTTQVRADIPFKNFSPPANREDLLNKIRKMHPSNDNEKRLERYVNNQLTRYSSKGKLLTLRALEDHLTVFKSKTFWTPRNNDFTVTIMISPKELGEPTIIKKGERLRTLKSSSVGSNYLLEWHEINPVYKSLGVIKATAFYS